MSALNVKVFGQLPGHSGVDSQVRDGILDIVQGVRSWRLWVSLGWHDIISRYRRSALGPAWLVLTLIVFIGALSLVYGTLFNIDLKSYMPLVTVGMVLWTFISGVLNDGAVTFVESEVYIKQVPHPLSLYVCRVLWRNIIVMGHSIPVVLIILALLGPNISATFHLAIPGMLIILGNLAWALLFVGLIGARFRDCQPMIAMLLQVVFLITPIFWPASLLQDRIWIASINPVYHLVELVRAPLLGQVPSLATYVVTTISLILGWCLAIALYLRFRNRIVYWL